MNKTRLSGVRHTMLKFSNKPVLVAGGCSFTDPNFKSMYHPEMDTSFAKWPDLVAKELNLKVVNTGASGSGNKIIADRVMDAVIENKNVELVMVLWSGFDRFSMYTHKFCPFSVMHNICFSDPVKPKSKVTQLFYKKAVEEWFNLEHNMRENLRIIYTLQEFLEHRSIKYIFAQGVDPYMFDGMSQLQENGFLKNTTFARRNKARLLSIVDDIYFDMIKEPHFYGWPGLEEAGGTNFTQWIRHKENKEDYHVSRVDKHPNALGHKDISEKFLQTYRRVYEKA